MPQSIPVRCHNQGSYHCVPQNPQHYVSVYAFNALRHLLQPRGIPKPAKENSLGNSPLMIARGLQNCPWGTTESPTPVPVGTPEHRPPGSWSSLGGTLDVLRVQRFRSTALSANTWVGSQLGAERSSCCVRPNIGRSSCQEDSTFGNRWTLSLWGTQTPKP